ncbi:MAG: hypothetical protein AAF570_21735, partial [Bacteroidota bacterium]
MAKEAITFTEPAKAGKFTFVGQFARCMYLPGEPYLLLLTDGTRIYFEKGFEPPKGWEMWDRLRVRGQVKAADFEEGGDWDKWQFAAVSQVERLRRPEKTADLKASEDVLLIGLAKQVKGQWQLQGLFPGAPSIDLSDAFAAKFEGEFKPKKGGAVMMVGNVARKNENKWQLTDVAGTFIFPQPRNLGELKGRIAEECYIPGKLVEENVSAKSRESGTIPYWFLKMKTGDLLYVYDDSG